MRSTGIIARKRGREFLQGVVAALRGAYLERALPSVSPSALLHLSEVRRKSSRWAVLESPLLGAGSVVSRPDLIVGLGDVLEFGGFPPFRKRRERMWQRSL